LGWFSGPGQCPVAPATGAPEARPAARRKPPVPGALGTYGTEGPPPAPSLEELQAPKRPTVSAKYVSVGVSNWGWRGGTTKRGKERLPDARFPSRALPLLVPPKRRPRGRPAQLGNLFRTCFKRLRWPWASEGEALAKLDPPIARASSPPLLPAGGLRRKGPGRRRRTNSGFPIGCWRQTKKGEKKGRFHQSKNIPGEGSPGVPKKAPPVGKKERCLGRGKKIPPGSESTGAARAPKAVAWGQNLPFRFPVSRFGWGKKLVWR